MSLGAELIAGETDFSGSVVILKFELSIWLFSSSFLYGQCVYTSFALTFLLDNAGG